MAEKENDTVFYIGITKQADVKHEDLRWLTARGMTPKSRDDDSDSVASDFEYDDDELEDEHRDDSVKERKHYIKNRPVLKWCNSETGVKTRIKMKEARETLGFVSDIVFRSQYLVDVSRVEDYLQNKFQHLKLSHRLWRCVAKGKSSDKNDVFNNCITKSSSQAQTK